MGTALQIETLKLISWSWSGTGQESIRSLSGVGQESVRSQSGVNQESVRSQSGVDQESVNSQSGVNQEYLIYFFKWFPQMSPKFGELIGTALQIWRAH